MAEAPARPARHIVVGDVHGELDALAEILRDAGLTGPDGEWRGGRTVLVQVGDVIDRGPSSVGCLEFLRRLQGQAGRDGGAVIRLCGNHELMPIQGDFYFNDFDNPIHVARQLREEVLGRTLVAAYTDGVHLFTHAGLRSPIFNQLRKEIRDAGGPGDEVASAAVVSRINELFCSGVRDNSYEHPIFYVSYYRGGMHSIGGIFWCDIREFSRERLTIPQVFGHSPLRRNALLYREPLKIINVDVGLCSVYGGYRAYLEIDAGGGLIQHYKGRRGWKAEELRDMAS